MPPIIQIENLGKEYTLHHRTRHGQGLRHALNNAFTAPFRAFRPTPTPTQPPAPTRESFWALRDLNFEIQPGEVVGIIGRNGAGKSTLLKLLSRITSPSTGRIILNGRVASLLEVGTGFHPELTGRENIFLNGAILGMTRAETKARFDEIVAFAEVQRFLDTPVKRYSSGMYMRLAFAVAAHLEPEILIVDEVLAVGDAAFQQKCLGKMRQVASQLGRTVLFVSHNLAAVQKLCSHCKLLEDGQLVQQGTPAEVISNYLHHDTTTTPETPVARSFPGGQLQIELLNPNGQPSNSWRFDQPLQVNVSLSLDHPLQQPAVDIAFYDNYRTRILSLQSDRLSESPRRINGNWTASFHIENPGLTLHHLTLDVGLRESTGEYLTLIEDAARIHIDQPTLPPSASDNAVLHPTCSQSWSPSHSSSAAA